MAGTTTARVDGGLVKCSDSGRWVFLEETAFKSLKEAKAAQYICTLCAKIKAAQEVLTAVKREREEKAHTETEFSAQCFKMRSMRELEAELREALEE